jgi:transposase
MGNRRISNDVKLAALKLFFHGQLALSDILDAVGFSRSTFFRVLNIWNETGQVSRERSYLRGRPRLLHREDVKYLLTLVKHRPQFFLQELQQLLLHNRLVSVHFTTIHRTFEKMGFSTKMLRKIAAERSDIVRADFLLRMGDYETEQLMFIDETAKDEKNITRRQGRSLIGTRSTAPSVFVRGTQFTLLPMLTVEGIQAATVVQGSVNKRLFIEFLRDHVVCSLLLYAVH